MIRLILALTVLSQVCHAQMDTAIFPDKAGDELLDSLVSHYKPVSILTYSEARDTLFANIDSREDSLTCVYSGHTVYLDPSLDPTQAAFMNGSNDGINTEHTFPQSFGAGGGNARSDMHHLFPTRTAVNSSRGNKIFGEIDDSTADQWYYQNRTQSNIPLDPQIDLYSETDSDTFEPREDHKGDVARAIFYFYTMYKAEADAASDIHFDSQIETLCDWHLLDPVDDKERQRTLGIAAYQEGKANPFVLDCSLPSRSYCPQQVCSVTSVEEEPLTQLTLSPNPATDYIQIHGLDPSSTAGIDVFDSVGRLVLSTPAKQLNGITLVEIGMLQPGIYAMSVSCNGTFETLQLAVVD